MQWGPLLTLVLSVGIRCRSSTGLEAKHTQTHTLTHTLDALFRRARVEACIAVPMPLTHPYPFNTAALNWALLLLSWQNWGFWHINPPVCYTKQVKTWLGQLIVIFLGKDPLICFGTLWKDTLQVLNLWPFSYGLASLTLHSLFHQHFHLCCHTWPRFNMHIHGVDYCITCCNISLSCLCI